MRTFCNIKTIYFLFFLIFITFAAFSDEFSFSADVMSGAMTKGRERVVLSGNAFVLSGKMKIYADKIELYGTDYRYIQCSSNVRLQDEEKGLKLSTSNLYYDRISKISRMTGSSVMEDRSNSVVIKGDFIENDEEKEIALIQVNVRILKDNLVCRAEFARYDRVAKTLALSGTPYVKRNNDEYRADKINVNLETEGIVLEGSVSGNVTATKKDDSNDNSSKKTNSDTENAEKTNSSSENASLEKNKETGVSTNE